MIDEATYEQIQAHRDFLMQEHGFLIDFVFPCEDSENQDWDIHTHGLVENFSHPEIQICIGLPQEIAMPIIHSIVSRIKAGEKFTHGQVDWEIAKDYPTYFIRVNENMVRLIVSDRSAQYLEEDVVGVYLQQYYAHPEQFTKSRTKS